MNNEPKRLEEQATNRYLSLKEKVISGTVTNEELEELHAMHMIANSHYGLSGGNIYQEL